MVTGAYIIPVFRAVTIVGTALSRDNDGDMSHITVTDTTLDELVIVMYEVKPSQPAGRPSRS